MERAEQKRWEDLRDTHRQMGLDIPGGDPNRIYHPYDIGYWSRVAGLSKPRGVGAQFRAGWKQADEDLAA